MHQRPVVPDRRAMLSRLLRECLHGRHDRPRAGASWRQTFRSLENRDFRHLWLGMLVMMGAMQMQMLARGFLVYDLTGQNAAILGVVTAANALPILALALFGGAIADRMERKRVVQLGQAGVGLLALFIAIPATPPDSALSMRGIAPTTPPSPDAHPASVGATQ